MRLALAFVAAAVFAASAGSAWCQTDQPVSPAASVAPATAIEAPASVRIPAGTLIQVEITEPLSSRTSQVGQTFGLRLVEPITIDGAIIVDVGAQGGGEVIDAHRSGMGGRQGKLIVSGRYIEIGGQHARIRGMQILAAGEDNTREAVNTAIIVGGAVGATIGLMIQGGEIDIPAGMRAEARIATEVTVTTQAPLDAGNIGPPVETSAVVGGQQQ